MSFRPVLGYRVRPCFDQIERGEGEDMVVGDEEGLEGTNPVTTHMHVQLYLQLCPGPEG